jgi:HKD family nuclease
VTTRQLGEPICFGASTRRLYCVANDTFLRVNMELLLHTPNETGDLSNRYRHAFSKAVELMIVNAYLTEWDSDLRLSSNCAQFRMIVGKDFGITRKAACVAVMNWLPSHLKANFLVADQIGGFHPKAIFWREPDGGTFAIVGSSNLTAAAFSTNYEANLYCKLTEDEFQSAKVWVAEISTRSVPVSPGWLAKYCEAPRIPHARPTTAANEDSDDIVAPLPLPKLKRSDLNSVLKQRRDRLAEHRKNRDGLITLFRRCAERKISSTQFYESLPRHWGGDVGGRLQGKGWERHGSKADFHSLSRGFLTILASDEDRRDDVVVAELDRLADEKNPARRAFLSEMLCLEFPKYFPVVNKPVETYLVSIDFKPPSGASEGAVYRDLAQKLRVSLLRLPDYPAKNLAELDAVIWFAHS